LRAERISELTGISTTAVRRHLSDEYKQEQEKGGRGDHLRRTRDVAVPEVAAEPIRKAIDGLQEIVPANPEKKGEIIRKFVDGVGFATVLSKPRKGRSKIPPEKAPELDVVGLHLESRSLCAESESVNTKEAVLCLPRKVI